MDAFLSILFKYAAPHRVGAAGMLRGSKEFQSSLFILPPPPPSYLATIR